MGREGQAVLPGGHGDPSLQPLSWLPSWPLPHGALCRTLGLREAIDPSPRAPVQHAQVHRLWPDDAVGRPWTGSGAHLPRPPPCVPSPLLSPEEPPVSACPLPSALLLALRLPCLHPQLDHFSSSLSAVSHLGIFPKPVWNAPLCGASTLSCCLQSKGHTCACPSGPLPLALSGCLPSAQAFLPGPARCPPSARPVTSPLF